MKRKLLLTIASIAALHPCASRAEEGAGGHYIPGATATFIDTLPGKPGIV